MHMHNDPIGKPNSYTYRTRIRDCGQPVIPPAVSETVKRGMTEHDAKAMAKGWTKSPKHPGRYRAERCGRTWDVIRTE